MSDALERTTALLEEVSKRLTAAEKLIKQLEADIEALEKWQEMNAPVLQQVRSRWHLPGPRCLRHGKRNCQPCFEAGT